MDVTCIIGFSLLDFNQQSSSTKKFVLSQIFERFDLTLEVMTSTRNTTSPTEAGLNLAYRFSANQNDMKQKAEEFISKLNLLASIIMYKEVKPFSYISISTEYDAINMDVQNDIFFGVKANSLKKYLQYENFDEYTVLVEAFSDLSNGKIFDAFPKFVNWLDYHDYYNAPQQKFCIIRTALSHTELHNTKQVNDQWPDLEFNENRFSRNKQNGEKLKEYLPELLHLVKERFNKVNGDDTDKVKKYSLSSFEIFVDSIKQVHFIITRQLVINNPDAVNHLRRIHYFCVRALSEFEFFKPNHVEDVVILEKYITQIENTISLKLVDDNDLHLIAKLIPMLKNEFEFLSQMYDFNINFPILK